MARPRVLLTSSVLMLAMHPLASHAYDQNYCGALTSLFEDAEKVVHDSTQYIARRLRSEGGSASGFKLGESRYAYAEVSENGFEKLDHSMRLAMADLLAVF